MNNYEEIVNALECCAYGTPDHCDVCPYSSKCNQKDVDTLALMKEMKAKLDGMPDYESECHRLRGENSRLKSEFAVMREEYTYLRGVKAVVEAALGRAIE
ncbi:MAG: hypothetical protein UHG68_08830 [Clostridia bacterium]|nr:hypothetical protein [Clostridia bacterium]